MFIFTADFPPKAEYNTKSVFKRCKTDLNSDFLLLDLLPNYDLRIKSGRLVTSSLEWAYSFMPFSTVLTRSEMKTASSMIWTRVIDSISYDGNRYAHYTSNVLLNRAQDHDCEGTQWGLNLFQSFRKSRWLITIPRCISWLKFGFWIFGSPQRNISNTYRNTIVWDVLVA